MISQKINVKVTVVDFLKGQLHLQMNLRGFYRPERLFKVLITSYSYITTSFKFRERLFVISQTTFKLNFYDRMLNQPVNEINREQNLFS
jgi:hypothetical protein